MESLFHIAFWIIFGGMIILQAIFAFRAGRTGTIEAAKYKKIEQDEGWLHAVVRTSRAIVLVAFLLMYAINSSWLVIFEIPLPNWLHWIGIVIGAASLAFYAWSRATLGKEWSSPLQVHEHHQLVTSGPYARVRHPIYLSLIVFMTGIALITANCFLVLFLVISSADLALRIPKEEQMMIEEFGDEYLSYMQRTGKLLPK